MSYYSIFKLACRSYIKMVLWTTKNINSEHFMPFGPSINSGLFVCASSSKTLSERSESKGRDAVNRTRTTAPPARRTTTILHPAVWKYYSKNRLVKIPCELRLIIYRFGDCFFLLALPPVPTFRRSLILASRVKNPFFLRIDRKLASYPISARAIAKTDASSCP